MKERPILFSSSMVRAILEGRKSQTRRALKLPGGGQPLPSDNRPWRQASDGIWYAWADNTPVVYGLRCPYGSRGDRLWVREAFSSFTRAGSRCKPTLAEYALFKDGTQVACDGRITAALPEYAPGAYDGIKWRPSIHMPRWASRITLEVMGVRVERLQDISEEDARAEGVERLPMIRRWRNYMPERESPRLTHTVARDSFFSLWESINGTESLAANPWVWVVEFRRVAR